MVGAGALQECLAEPQVQSVIAITRSRIGRSHPKLREVLHADFFAYDNVRAEFASCDACFFCLGVTSVGLGEPAYFHLTYDLTLTAAAREMAAVNATSDLLLHLGIRNRQHRTRTPRGRESKAYPACRRSLQDSATSLAAPDD